MPITTYAELKTAIDDWTDHSLSDHVDTFIDIAEARHKREIRIREMLSTATLTISEDDQTEALPSDFLDAKHIRIQVPTSVSTNGRKYFPDTQQLSFHELTQVSTNVKQTPCYFAITTQIEFDSPADQSYTGELLYYAELADLDDTDTTNALLARAPDVYLYSCLAATAPFMMHDERVALWESLYKESRDRLNQSTKEGNRTGPLSSVPHAPLVGRGYKVR